MLVSLLYPFRLFGRGHGSRIYFRQLHRHSRQNTREVVDPTIVQRNWALLTKPAAFTIGVSLVSFAGASIWQYENVRLMASSALKPGRAVKEQMRVKAGSIRQQINSRWNRITANQKVGLWIIATNIGVFLAWRLAPFQPILFNVMYRFFLATPFSSIRSLPLLLSTFSHSHFLHIFLNMYVLWSFVSPSVLILGREQFLAFYLSAGVLTAFASYVAKIAQLSAIPSLGASGAIMALLGLVCSRFPDAQMRIAFIGDIIPFDFSAANCQKALIAFDLTGLLLRWKYLDHAAHLSGMLFGMWYAKYGHEMIWSKREPLLKLWHRFRGDV